MMRRCRPRSDVAVFGLLAGSATVVRGQLMALRSLRSRSAALGVGACGVLLAGQLACGAKPTAPVAGTIAAIRVSPDSVSLSPGSAETLKAEAQTAASQPVSDQHIFWSTSDSLVATITQSGVVVAHKPGAVQIGASAQGRSGFARVVVVNAAVHSVKVKPSVDSIYAGSPGNTVTLTATTYDSSGHVLAGRPLLWTSNSAVVTIASGRVAGTNTAAGTAIITATSPDSGFPSGSAKITVIGHVASVALQPSSAWLSRDGAFFLPQTLLPTTIQLTATLTDTFGHDVSGRRTVTWSSADPTVATVNHSGLVTAVSTTKATTTITAKTPDGKSTSAAITVFP